MYDIVTCGSATVDMFVDTKSSLINVVEHGKKKLMIAYPAGGKILIDHIHSTVGGGGTNTAVGFSRLGLKTAYFGCIGADEHADTILTALKKDNITFIGQKDKQPSGFSIILDSIAHDRTILAHKGSNDDLSMPTNKFPKTKWVYFSSMLGKSLKTQKALAKEVKKSGTKIVYNPSEYQVRKGITPIKPLLSLCDILIFNRTEAQILTGKKSSTAILKFLHNLGINIVVITDGPNTIECSNGSHIIKLEPKRVKVKEATGAGDAFSSGFISWYIKTNDLVQSLHAGLANSESVLQHYGAKDKLLTYKELKRKLKF